MWITIWRSREVLVVIGQEIGRTLFTFVKSSQLVAMAGLTWFAMAATTPCLADVLEVGGDGAVTTYRGPAVFTSEGVRQIKAVPLQQRQVVSIDVTSAIQQAAQRQALDARLLEAVAWRESGFRQSAVSPKGAVGVMQIMPATARALGVDRYDMTQNIEGGASYLRQMLGRYSGNLSLALAAYNAGPGAVDRYGGIPPFRETQSYVDAVVSRLASRAGSLSLTSSALIEP